MSANADIVRLSPNLNNAPVRGRTVIIHATRSGKAMNPTEFVGTLNYMSQAGTTSSHWVVSRLGVKARVVPNDRQAWHAQEDNDNAWGIELEQGAEQDGFTMPQMVALAEICRDEYMADHGVPAVRSAAGTEPGFLGHQDTAQGRRNGKSDPGSGFDWGLFFRLLKGNTMPEPQPTLEAALTALVNAGAIMAAGNRSLEELSTADKSALKWVVETAKA